MRVFCVVAPLLALMVLSGCGKPEPPVVAEPGADVYTVRGQIASLPVVGKANTDFLVTHEMIPSFRKSDGTVAPMNAMTMPFPPASDETMADLAVGDKVELTFSVKWKPDISWRTLRIEKLPADTPLKLAESMHMQGDEGHGDHAHDDHAGHAH